MNTNVLIFMTDQQRGATVLPEHRLKARTPFLDAFRQRAATFARSYTPSPHCCPSRASFFTGLYPSEHGVWNNVNLTNAFSRGPREGTAYWSSSFIRAGYELAISGKWHVSNAQRPSELGWRELMVSPPMPPKPCTLEGQRDLARAQEIRNDWKGPSPSSPQDRIDGEIIRPGFPQYIHYGVKEHPWQDDAVVDQAEAYIRGEAGTGDKPWLLYVGTMGPHDPYTPPQRFLDMYNLDDIELPENFADPMADKPTMYRRTRDRFDQLSEREQRETIRHYLAFCSYEDYLFGRLLDALDESGASDNTAVLYLSDHGDYTGDHGLWCKGLPSFESAYHIPTVISWPGMPTEVQGTICNSKISLVDMGPTLLDMSGLEPTTPMSGISLAPLLTGKHQGEIRDELFFQSNGNEAYGIQRIVVTDRWKLVCNLFDDDELYDLGTDPDEMNNLLHTRTDARRTEVGPLDVIPENLHAVVKELYQRVWNNALRYNDEIFNQYIFTALSSYGPTIVDQAQAHNA
ncbi:arylsulfatase A-like enzyme [Arthrobacter sp. AG258]|uniref:sulfatase-like hydrolase/transferase n=1 Tax=Arthrobacter sp. AG258 TaxID=2183899 RepID=UPI00105F05D6|nr:sulfatase-like hydrolase/transferase [Arthrobacter sp. AG258]TDT74706.1 arylsulfatase A-like enzyme [Arthrobacter sp. AG258]